MDQITKIRADLQIAPGQDGDILRTEGTKVKWGKISQDNIENLSEELSALNTAISDKATKAELNAKADKATTYTKDEVDSKVNTKVAEVIDSAPEALNTLQELSKALGDDPNFATTILNEMNKSENALTSRMLDIETRLVDKAIFDETVKITTSSSGNNMALLIGNSDESPETAVHLGISPLGDLLWASNNREIASIKTNSNGITAKNLTVDYDTVSPTNLVTKDYVDNAIQSHGTPTIAFPRIMTVPIDSNNVSRPSIAAATVTPEGEKKMPNVDGVLVYRNGLLQVKGADYSVPSGADFSVSFTQPLVVGEVIQFVYVG